MFLSISVLMLLRHGASISELTGPPHKSPIQLAAAGGHIEVMEVLTSQLSSHQWKWRDDWGWTLLHEVAHTGDKDVIRVSVIPLSVAS